LSFVTSVFYEESLDLKRAYIINNNATYLIMGDDWINKFDDLKDICDVYYLPRTVDISTTEIIEKIVKSFSTVI
jgi:glycerol-3-phosphate cytidylyltransferase